MNAFTLNYDLRQLPAQYESVCNWSRRKGLAFIFHSISEMTAPQPAPERARERKRASGEALVNLEVLSQSHCRALVRRALVCSLQALTSRGALGEGAGRNSSHFLN